MSKVKTEILGPVISDFLKYEATPQTRVAVAADAGTKAGKFVEYPLRGKKLLALTDEADGKVIIQPFNCIIDPVKSRRCGCQSGDHRQNLGRAEKRRRRIRHRLPRHTRRLISGDL